MRVIFAEDFKKPACPNFRPFECFAFQTVACVLHRIRLYQLPSNQWPPNSFVGPHCQRSIFDVMSNILVHSDNPGSCTSFSFFKFSPDVIG
jgi:hypothetical protein